METAVGIMIAIFVVGYAAIALEHPIKINKSATAILLAVLLWVIFNFGVSEGVDTTLHQLSEHLAGIAQLLFFLLGAMTIVEVVSQHNGFKVVTDLIQTTNKKTLMWIIGFITFFLSSVLDNMTTAIVIVTLLGKLLTDRHDRLVFASIVIIAANAGGAWTPIGDVTTTMLWIGGQITTINIMKVLFIPSMICLIIPLLYQSLYVKGTFESGTAVPPAKSTRGSNLFFWLGIGGLIFVPVFKATTGLPPYLGMLCSLSVIWLISEIMHRGNEDEEHLLINNALSKIDVPSVLFFLGILLAVGCLESAQILHAFAGWLDNTIGNKEVIVTIIGLLSAIVDNIPLTAACMGMYPMDVFPPDHKIWEMLAYAVGTGGSCLIIGSAAGVVAMGIEKIEFIWYMKKITFTALIGYFAGIFTYLFMYWIEH